MAAHKNGVKDTRPTHSPTYAAKSGMYTRPKLKTYREGVMATTGVSASGKPKPSGKIGKSEPC